MGTVTQLAVAALPQVTGYVEAVTADRVAGWAWSAQAPDARAEVELRLGEEVVARAVADQPRPDLATNGIGDGAHAYVLPIPEAARGRAAELRVFARVGQGAVVPIGAPPPPDTLSDQIERLCKGVDVLIGGQRVLHRTLQTAMAGREGGTGDAAAIAAVMQKQDELAGQIATLERFVIRLDEVLATPGVQVARRTPLAALAALAVAGCALAVSVYGLVGSLAG